LSPSIVARRGLTPPCLPFLEALNEYVRSGPLDDLRAQLGDGAPDVALVLPEVGRRLPDLPARHLLAPESDRYRLFDSLSAFIGAIARFTQRPAAVP
jgi:hypothetical protein